MIRSLLFRPSFLLQTHPGVFLSLPCHFLALFYLPPPICVYTNNIKSEVEDALKRISAAKGVTGVLVTSKEGVTIKSTLDPSVTVQYAGLIVQLVTMASGAVRELDPSNALTFLRLRTKKHEIMVAPGKPVILCVCVCVCVCIYISLLGIIWFVCTDV